MVVEIFAPRVLAVSAPCVSVVVDTDVLEQLELGQLQHVRDGPDHVLHAAAFEDLLVVELAESHRHEDLVAVAALDDTTDVAVVDGRGLFLLGLVDRDATSLTVGALRLQRLLELVAGRSLVTVPVQQDVDTGGTAADERHQVAGAVVPERESRTLVRVDPPLQEAVVCRAELLRGLALDAGLLLQERIVETADVRLDRVNRRAVGRRSEVPERLRRQQICGDHDLATEVFLAEERSHALRGVLVGRSLEVGCDHDSAGEVEAAHIEQRAAASTDVLELRVLLNGLEQVARAGCGLVGVLLSEVVGEDLAVLELTLRYEHDRDAAVHQLVEAELRAGVVAAERVDGEEHHVVARRAGRCSSRALQHRAGQDAEALLLRLLREPPHDAAVLGLDLGERVVDELVLDARAQRGGTVCARALLRREAEDGRAVGRVAAETFVVALARLAEVAAVVLRAALLVGEVSLVDGTRREVARAKVVLRLDLGVASAVLRHRAEHTGERLDDRALHPVASLIDLQRALDNSQLIRTQDVVELRVA